ncbi:hypothetical protein ASPCAL14435 [Aspergillus calidoustus]|uniref:AB hydrolase-1 domain-containing protein n=1 Tax=Aspergillus calidoustus TaxID=454130 RepID=A0A0U5HAV5_ASPCI|nr:hypothetical protein ASPCAL14435 [Aspergillus calidoustus]
MLATSSFSECHSLRSSSSTSLETMVTEKPTILLIPGAWHRGSTFEPVAKILREQGYEAEAITLPSVGGPSSTTAYDDARHVQETYLTSLVAEGKEVIIVMHSYAGIPGTECVKGFARKDLAAQGKHGGVVGLVYIAAFLVPAGASVATFLPDGLDSFMALKVSRALATRMGMLTI